MLSVLDSDKRLADHFGGKVSPCLSMFPCQKTKLSPNNHQMHLGYHAIRELLAKFAEERMTARSAPAPTPVPRQQPPPSAPSGPSSSHAHSNAHPQQPPPHTPSHPRVPPADEIPHIGHGDKVKREAGELVDDIKDVREKEKERDRDRDRVGHSETRSSRGEKEEKGHRERDKDRYGDRDEKDRYDKYEKHDRDRREER